MLIGNKIDASHRWVTKEEGEDLAKQFGITFFETSAKVGTNVTEAFYAISQSLTGELSQKHQTFQINQQPIQTSQEDVEIKQVEQKQEAFETFKILIIDDSGVWKNKHFTKSQYCSTIGIDFKIKSIEEEGNNIKMQIWDTSGQERFKIITQSYYKGAMGIILVYSVNEKESLNNIKNWMKEIMYHAGDNACKLLIGNKIDISKRQVSREEGEDLAKQFGIPFFETSAKDGTNLADVFYQMAKPVIIQRKKTKQIEQKPVPKEAQVKIQAIQQKQDVQSKVFKMLIIGDAGVGKTNILLRFCENSFQSSYISTIGIDFKIKSIEEDGSLIKMQIWDTSGQERFKTITQTYYRGAMAIILVYSVDDKESFKNITNWVDTIEQHTSKTVCRLLIGNKDDTPNRQVTMQEGEELAKQLGITFFETSAKMGTNVANAFYTISKLVKGQLGASNYFLYMTFVFQFTLQLYTLEIIYLVLPFCFSFFLFNIKKLSDLSTLALRWLQLIAKNQLTFIQILSCKILCHTQMIIKNFHTEIQRVLIKFNQKFSFHSNIIFKVKLMPYIEKAALKLSEIQSVKVILQYLFRQLKCMNNREFEKNVEEFCSQLKFKAQY